MKSIFSVGDWSLVFILLLIKDIGIYQRFIENNSHSQSFGILYFGVLTYQAFSYLLSAIYIN